MGLGLISPSFVLERSCNNDSGLTWLSLIQFVVWKRIGHYNFEQGLPRNTIRDPVVPRDTGMERKYVDSILLYRTLRAHQGLHRRLSLLEVLNTSYSHQKHVAMPISARQGYTSFHSTSRQTTDLDIIDIQIKIRPSYFLSRLDVTTCPTISLTTKCGSIVAIMASSYFAINYSVPLDAIAGDVSRVMRIPDHPSILCYTDKTGLSKPLRNPAVARLVSPLNNHHEVIQEMALDEAIFYRCSRSHRMEQTYISVVSRFRASLEVLIISLRWSGLISQFEEGETVRNLNRLQRSWLEVITGMFEAEIDGPPPILVIHPDILETFLHYKAIDALYQLLLWWTSPGTILPRLPANEKGQTDAFYQTNDTGRPSTYPSLSKEHKAIRKKVGKDSAPKPVVILGVDLGNLTTTSILERIRPDKVYLATDRRLCHLDALSRHRPSIYGLVSLKLKNTNASEAIVQAIVEDLDDHLVSWVHEGSARSEDHTSLTMDYQYNVLPIELPGRPSDHTVVHLLIQPRPLRGVENGVDERSLPAEIRHWIDSDVIHQGAAWNRHLRKQSHTGPLPQIETSTFTRIQIMDLLMNAIRQL